MSDSSPNNVTRILHAVERGEEGALDELLPMLYDELRLLAVQKLSHEAPGQTLQATALVHEVFLRLTGGNCPASTARCNCRPCSFSRLAIISNNRPEPEAQAMGLGQTHRVDGSRRAWLECSIIRAIAQWCSTSHHCSSGPPNLRKNLVGCRTQVNFRVFPRWLGTGAGVVAYDKLIGDVKWKTPNLGNESYASPSVAKIDGKDHAVMVISSTNPFGNRGLPRTLGKIVGRTGLRHTCVRWGQDLRARPGSSVLYSSENEMTA